MWPHMAYLCQITIFNINARFKIEMSLLFDPRCFGLAPLRMALRSSGESKVVMS